MSVLFVGLQHVVLLNCDSRRGEIFVAMTQAISEVMQMEMPINPELRADEYWVDEEKFCALVEKLFQSPNEMFYSWAQWAAGMYEMCRGERCEWQWLNRAMPWIPTDMAQQQTKVMGFITRNCGVNLPTETSGRVIGPAEPQA